MFNYASNKIEDTRIIFDKLSQSSDFLEFKSYFNSFLSSARAITNALQKQGKTIEGFSGWIRQAHHAYEIIPGLYLSYDSRYRRHIRKNNQSPQRTDGGIV